MKSARVLMARNTKKKDSQDFLETPIWVTNILFDHQPWPFPVWEPACGAGKMSKVIWKRTGQKVYSSDKYDHGYGHTGIDFLQADKLRMPSIITNPPNNLLNRFMRTALELRPEKLALLVRTLSLETQGRYKIFEKYPPMKIIVIADRVNFDGSEEPGGYWSYSWMIWQLNYRGPTTIEWASFYD